MAFLTRVDPSFFLVVIARYGNNARKTRNSELKSFYWVALEMFSIIHRNLDKFLVDYISVAVSQDWAAVVGGISQW